MSKIKRKIFSLIPFWRPVPVPAVAPRHVVAFVSDAVWPYHFGGRETRLHEIAKRLVNEQREVYIYTMKWWPGSEQEINYDGIRFRALCAVHPLYVNGRRSILQALIFALSVLKLTFRRFDVLDVDHMPFFPLFSARLVTWVRGKPLQATWHEVWGKQYWTEYIGRVSGTFGWIMEWLSYWMPDAIVSNSVHTTKRLLAAGVRCKIHTIPLGVDLEHIYAARPKGKRSDVIFVGRLLSHKNADLLVRAIGIVRRNRPDIACNIVGDGPEKSRITDLVHELGLEDNVMLLSRVERHQDLYGLLKASKMFVLPSVREGFSIATVEAHAAGLPVITTTHPDNAAKDLIREGVNGFLTDGTPKGMADSILRVLKVRKTMEPKHEIERYDWREVARQMAMIPELSADISR